MRSSAAKRPNFFRLLQFCPDFLRLSVARTRRGVRLAVRVPVRCKRMGNGEQLSVQIRSRPHLTRSTIRSTRAAPQLRADPRRGRNVDPQPAGPGERDFWGHRIGRTFNNPMAPRIRRETRNGYPKPSIRLYHLLPY